LSVSARTSFSSVWKKTRVPSAEAPLKLGKKKPLPWTSPAETYSRTLWLAPATPADTATAVESATTDARTF
jgi:hypothetical protein